MKSSHKFSFSFDPELLVRDLDLISKEWISHFNTTYYHGDWKGIPLREPENSAHKLAANNENKSFRNTPLLERSNYFQKVLSYFDCPKTSLRLLKLTPGSIIKQHTDPDLSFWEGLARIHIPILTNNLVRFELDGVSLDMKPGECWFGEFALPHCVANYGKTERIHLVVDLNVNNWLHKLFIKEGIVGPNEKKPDPISRYSQSELSDMVRSLVAMGTDTSLDIAKKVCSEHGFKIEDFNP